MVSSCEDCRRTFKTEGALQQHLQDAPVHAVTFDCGECRRTFKTEEALQHHLRDAPVHAVTFDCGECRRTFKTEEALQHHLRDAPVHAVTFDCGECCRSFKSEEALQQHLQDAPVHAVTFDCGECCRTFKTEEALQHHLRDSPVHTDTFDSHECGTSDSHEGGTLDFHECGTSDCCGCDTSGFNVCHTFDCNKSDRTFTTAQAFQQHSRYSPVHIVNPPTVRILKSFDMWPSLHEDVLQLLHPYGLRFQFFAADTSRGVLQECDSSIMGKFTCTNRSCRPRKWTSGRVAITIRLYSNQRYNARVYSQRCELCNSIGRLELDGSYAERVSYRLAKWSGIAPTPPPYSPATKKPHHESLCEGCKFGHCSQNRL